MRILPGTCAAILAACAFASPASAATGCITEAEVDAAVGADLRAGAFTVRTDRLGERPLCSGLTMAQTVQKLRARYVQPDPPPQALANQTGSAPPAGAAMPDISRTLAFEEPAVCTSTALAEFFDKAEKSGGAVLGPLGRVTVTRSRPDAHGTVTRRATIRARWNGLTIVALEYITSPDSEYTEIRLHNVVFAEPGAVAGPTLARMGFGVSRVGEEKEIYDQGTMMNPYFIALRARDKGSMLQCY